jgi:hypothetical protein
VADSQPPEIPGRPRLADTRHDGDLSLSPDGHRALSAHCVFVSDEVLLDVSFPAARARLAGLIRGGLLGSASARAYGEGITGLARSGPPGPAPGLPGLVQVHARELTAGDGSGRVALRWEAAGPAGGVFPALDADITLAPAGEQAATLTLTGVYRLPPGLAGPGLDRAVVLRCATAMIQAFLGHVIEAIAVAGGPGIEATDPQAP